MSLSEELQATSGARETRRLAIIAQITALTDKARVARRLFCDDKGEVTADAAAFFAHIAHHAGMNRRGFVVDPRLRDYRDGAQELVRAIIDMMVLDANRLRHLQQQLHSIEGKTRP